MEGIGDGTFETDCTIFLILYTEFDNPGYLYYKCHIFL